MTRNTCHNELYILFTDTFLQLLDEKARILVKSLMYIFFVFTLNAIGNGGLTFKTEMQQ